MSILRCTWVLFLLVASCVAASAQTLTHLSVVEIPNATQIHLDFDEKAPLASKMFAISDGKPRLVLDFKDVEHALTHTRSRVAGAGTVQAVRYARRGKDEQDIRLVIDLASDDVRPEPKIQGNRLSVVLYSTTKPTTQDDRPITQVKAQQFTALPRYFRDKMPYPRLKPKGDVISSPKPVRKPVIVIDPGHGGRDPGAIGKAGTFEKKITWAASTELKKQLEDTGRYTVIMTRSKDVYVAHDERLRIARAGGADLFISIHADATESGTARGASVYTLADRAINRSKRIVNSQNWIMDVDLSEQSDPVGDILVDLAQRKTATQSDQFAELLLTQLSKSTQLIGNSHRRAGYFVLLAPDVPAVLLELGFLSNAEDEALLNKRAHRKKVVSSVTKAINLHFEKQKS